MREITQICPLNGAMVKDVAPKFIDSAKGQVIERVNLRNTGLDGDTFVNKKFKGTLLVEADLPVTGTNKAIGSIKDTQNDALIYFVYNSLGNHCVFRYMTKTKVLQNIWLNKPELDLEDTPLRGQVVEGKVYWVNGTKQPKAFDIIRAYNYTNSIVSDDTYTASDLARTDFFLYATEPPKFAPSCIYDSDDTVNFNNLRKKLFQFKYAYQYFDDQVSSWSPISKVPVPGGEISSEGEFTSDITINNKIIVTVNSGSRLVKKILVAARDASPRNTGAFFQFAEIDRASYEEEQTSVEVDFYNNKITKSIDTEIGNRYSDNVPLSGNDMLLLSNKYLSISLPEIGYDNIETDYTLSPYEEAKEFQERIPVLPSPGMRVDMSYSQKLQGHALEWSRVAAVWLPSTFIPNATYAISFTAFNNFHFYFQIVAGETYSGYPETMRNAFLDQINNKVASTLTELNPDDIYIENIMVPKGIFGALQDVPTGIAIAFSPGPPISPIGDTVSNLVGQLYQDTRTLMPAYKHLKRGQYHPFALIYNDSRGRYNVVQGDKELYSPLFTSNSETDTKKIIRCLWEINHRPPIEAVAYRWCYIRNKSYTYFEYFYNAISKRGDGVDANGIPAGKYFIGLNQSLQRVRDLYPNFIISDYIWQNGDRIRVAGSETSYEILKEHLWIDPTPDSITGEDGINGFLIDVDLSTVTVSTNRYLPLVEVYRQNPSPQDNIYLEIGEEFEILEAGTANRRHAGPVSNQSANLGTTAKGLFEFGDVYLRGRVFVGADLIPVFLPIEHEYLSDYYKSDSIDVGRAGAKIESKNKVLNRIVRSENYIEDTEFNDLNVWLSGTDFHTASNVDGQITGMELAGDVLKVIQSHKEASIYVGKTEVRDGGGNTMLTLSDNTFTTPRTYAEFRGTTYRNSLVSNERNIYYFDESTGEFIRSSPNGQEAISTLYGYKSFFEKKAKALREYNGHKDVIVGINNDYKEVYISFIMGTTNETVVFSEDPSSKGWKSFISLSTATAVPELFADFGDRMFSFLKGNLYVHDSGTTLNNFYGEQKGFSIKVPVNNLSHETKRFRNIQINSDQNVYDIQFDIPESNTYGQQRSYLKPSVMRTTNNRIVADILRNVITELGQENLNLLYDGQKLIGEHVIVTLSGTGSEEIELREIEVKSLIST